MGMLVAVREYSILRIYCPVYIAIIDAWILSQTFSPEQMQMHPITRHKRDTRYPGSLLSSGSLL